MELLADTVSEGEYRRLQSRLSSLYYIESTQSLGNDASKLAFNLRRAGVTVPSTDIFIAAASIHEEAILLHADTHFDLIAGNSDLEVESLVDFIG